MEWKPFSIDFYRAMLCIAQTMPSQDVCPSVTRRYSVETVIDVLERLHRRVAMPFQFFRTKR